MSHIKRFSLFSLNKCHNIWFMCRTHDKKTIHFEITTRNALVTCHPVIDIVECFLLLLIFLSQTNSIQLLEWKSLISVVDVGRKGLFVAPKKNCLKPRKFWEQCHVCGVYRFLLATPVISTFTWSHWKFKINCNVRPITDALEWDLFGNLEQVWSMQ